VASGGESSLLSSFSSVHKDSCRVSPPIFVSQRGLSPTRRLRTRTESIVVDVKAGSYTLPWQETREDEYLCCAVSGAEQPILLQAVLLKTAAGLCLATSHLRRQS
jgi:hypothetical protein